MAATYNTNERKYSLSKDQALRVFFLCYSEAFFVWMLTDASRFSPDHGLSEAVRRAVTYRLGRNSKRYALSRVELLLSWIWNASPFCPKLPNKSWMWVEVSFVSADGHERVCIYFLFRSSFGNIEDFHSPEGETGKKKNGVGCKISPSKHVQLVLYSYVKWGTCGQGSTRGRRSRNIRSQNRSLVF